jgi:hypothetical protein
VGWCAVGCKLVERGRSDQLRLGERGRCFNPATRTPVMAPPHARASGTSEQGIERAGGRRAASRRQFRDCEGHPGTTLLKHGARCICTGDLPRAAIQPRDAAHSPIRGDVSRDARPGGQALLVHRPLQRRSPILEPMWLMFLRPFEQNDPALLPVRPASIRPPGPPWLRSCADTSSRRTPSKTQAAR